jgi:hypothetical protein
VKAGSASGNATYTEQEVTSQEHFDIGSEELDEQETGQGDEGDEHGESVTESFREGTGDLKTEDVSDLHGARQTSLPSSGDLVSAGFRVEGSILLSECRLRPELTLHRKDISLCLG